MLFLDEYAVNDRVAADMSAVAGGNRGDDAVLLQGEAVHRLSADLRR
jgi:hypothetical protein